MSQANQVHLSRKLDLEAVTRQPDGAGGYVESWAVLGSLWADLRPGSSRTQGVAAADLSLVAYRIIVRAAPIGAASRPKPEQRLRDGTRVFQIYGVADFDRGGLFLECFTREKVSP